MENNAPNPNYYGVLPAPVRYCKDISASEKVLYAEIAALANAKGYCWASNDYFANLYDVVPTCVSKWISALTKNGFLKVETIYIAQYNKNERRLYLADLSSPTCQKEQGGVVENDKGGLPKRTRGGNKKEQEGVAEKGKHNTKTPNTITSNTSSNEDVNGKKNEKQIFDLRRELMQRNLHKVAEIAKMPNEQWYRQTLQNYSDAYFWEVCKRLNEWLNNKKGKPYTDFAKVFANWALSPNGNETLKGLNDFWQKQYGAPYKEAGELGKGDKDAINAIGEFLNTKSIEKGSNWTSTLQDIAAVFFEKLPERWRNLSYFKLISIANDLPQIYAMITNPHTTSKQAIKEAEVIEAATEKYMQRKEAESQMPNAMQAIAQLYTNILSKSKNNDNAH